MKVKGLTQAEADLRLKKDGLNQVPEPEFSFWKEFAGKLWNLSAWILEAALLLECALGKWIQSLFVLLITKLAPAAARIIASYVASNIKRCL